MLIKRAHSLFNYFIFILQILTAISRTRSYGEVADTEVMNDSHETLIGWKGESYHPKVEVTNEAVVQTESSEWIETLSWWPRAFLYHHFLKDEECDHLISIANDRLTRSLVVGEKGQDVIDSIRTSFSASLGIGEDEVVLSIEERIATWTHLPRSHGEPIEVLRYQNGQKYDQHWDFFDAVQDGDVLNETCGNGVATVLMYLSDVEKDAGGETSLPLAEELDAWIQSASSTGLSSCAEKLGVAVKPKKGSALLFWDMHPDGNTTDRRALHASCPTFRGTKWTATRWIHVRPTES
ncbi:hypothetical protein CEUSTIGMA_g1892.t1 [Chlamydomonas eustigma]|uniref:Fe2OG dioxygenase domain-containing protein n=1 Tax=Chlamydomonas eustigma TaxID=1157962 RepID=A0A250WUE1_9CHLO|nr:hypothetical protein CEUSTIGMA_g1892.t1 [Chlamydomonas eustigma]|eukprot:GAX74443.1 hypothetical protein CEUSTIGMA_g1892.t1 [Chlamydomonas eustigma]